MAILDLRMIQKSRYSRSISDLLTIIIKHFPIGSFVNFVLQWWSDLGFLRHKNQNFDNLIIIYTEFRFNQISGFLFPYCMVYIWCYVKILSCSDGYWISNCQNKTFQGAIQRTFLTKDNAITHTISMIFKDLCQSENIIRPSSNIEFVNETKIK